MTSSRPRAARPAASRCRQMTASQLHYAWQSAMLPFERAQHESVYNFGALRGASSASLGSDGAVTERVAHLFSDQHCPQRPQTAVNAALRDRALCPWYSVNNQDDARYPRQLAEVRCRCRHCIGLAARGGGGHVHRCESIFYRVRVLRRVNTCDVNGRYVYRKSWQRLVIGCTCAHIAIA